MSFDPESRWSNDQNQTGTTAEAVEDLKRNLYQDVMQHIDEPLKVYLRIRRCTEDEKNNNIKMVSRSIETEEGLMNVQISNSSKFNAAPLKFKFSRIYNEDDDQSVVFNTSISDVIEKFINGSNCLVFNYGVTNAGKTYTMQGTPSQPGIIPRALNAIFQHVKGKLTTELRVKPHNGGVLRIKQREALNVHELRENIIKMHSDVAGNTFMETFMSSQSCSEGSFDIYGNSTVLTSNSNETSTHSQYNFSRDSLSDTQYSIWVSFIEVYNEHIFDLLVNAKGKKRIPLRLYERSGGQIFIKGMNEVCVFSAEEAYRTMLVGQKNLHYAVTKLNHNSSRSHCIFTLKLLSTSNGNEFKDPFVTQFAFCDLAGSERSSKSKCVGDQLREAGIINLSLMVLGRCIETLRNNQRPSKEKAIVPFRESKLTRLLQKYFTEKSTALMIVNISPCEDVVDETMHVLKFSAIAKELLLPSSIDFLNEGKLTRRSLDFLRKSLMERDSVQWEHAPGAVSPGHYASDAFDEEEEYEEENDERIQKLIDIIKILHQRLNDERQEKLNIEHSVRDELCSHFVDQMREMEDYYRGRIAEEVAIADEASEERIKILTEYVQESKRERTEENDCARVVCSSNEKDLRIADLEYEIRHLENAAETTKRGLKEALGKEAEARECLFRVRLQMSELEQKYESVLRRSGTSRNTLEGPKANESSFIIHDNGAKANETSSIIHDNLMEKEVPDTKQMIEDMKSRNAALENEVADLKGQFNSTQKAKLANGELMNDMWRYSELIQKCITKLRSENCDFGQNLTRPSLQQTVYFSASSDSQSCEDSDEKHANKIIRSARFVAKGEEKSDVVQKNLNHPRSQEVSHEEELISDIPVTKIEVEPDDLDEAKANSCIDELKLQISEIEAKNVEECEGLKAQIMNRETELKETDMEKTRLKQLKDRASTVMVGTDPECNSDKRASVLLVENENLLLKLKTTEKDLRESNCKITEIEARYQDLLAKLETKLETVATTKSELEENMNEMEKRCSFLRDENDDLRRRLKLLEHQSCNIFKENGDDSDENDSVKESSTYHVHRLRMRKEAKSYFESDENSPVKSKKKSRKKHTSALQESGNDNTEVFNEMEMADNSCNPKKKVNLAKKSQSSVVVSPTAEAKSESKVDQQNVLRKLRRRKYL